jgi:biopolymer transport protein ExbD
MKRRTLTLIAVSLVVVAFGPLGEIAAGKAPAPVISLPRVGTIGDHPPAGQRTVVEVDAAGIIRVRKQKMSLDELALYLRKQADRKRLADIRKTSAWYVVIRMDRTVPWGVAQWIMQMCARPNVRITRVHFAVLPEKGDEEGTLATHLPSGQGLGRLSSAPLRVHAGGPGSDPTALYAKFKGRIETPCEVNANRLVPLGYVLRVVDVLHRAGTDAIFFRGTPPPAGETAIADLIREARAVKDGPTITVGGDQIAREPAAALPSRRRVRGDFAGTVAPWVSACLTAGSMAGRRLRATADSTQTEGAVDLGLGWLAKHQDPAGFWDCDGYTAQCAHDKCGGKGYSLFDPGVTGLALLAFLGAGETHKAGRYQKTVKNGLKSLKQIQDPEGCFGKRTSNRFTFNHGIAALAMTEAYALTGSPLFKQSSQSAIDFIIKCQNPHLGWRYGVQPGDNDTTVTGWMVMALKSAKEAGGLRVPEAGFKGAKAWLDKATEPEYGKVGYSSRGTGPGRPQDIMDDFPADRSEALTAQGILCRIIMGENPATSEMVKKGVDLCLAVPPKWDETDGSIDMYYWYFGSLALFQVGGEPWKAWNVAMKKAILPHQRKDGCAKGSWDPLGPWGREGGRVYATAMMTMCLEVYYRYDRLFPVGK